MLGCSISSSHCLLQEKRILKKKRDSSELADREYRQKCNEVRKAVRADKAKWLERQCEDIEKYYGEYKTREVYKTFPPAANNTVTKSNTLLCYD